MNQFFSNRYVQLSLLTLFIAALIYGLLVVLSSFAGFEFPQFFLIVISLGGAGLLVYKFFASRLNN